VAGHSGSFIETPYTSADYNPANDHAFVMDGSGSAVSGNSSDWLYPHVSASDLWGNGLAIDATPGGNGEIVNGSVVPPVKNTDYDPCPSGYRVPTQYEWALLGNEGGNSGNTSNDKITSMTASGKSGSSGIVWVPVSEGTASTVWSGGKTNGYALYAADVWSTATGKTNLLADNAPEPLLFLPAGGIRDYNDGGVRYTGSDGYYWSSVVSGTYSYYMTFTSSSVSANTRNNRASGLSVRCVAAE
jgi:hypothetical protein